MLQVNLEDVKKVYEQRQLWNKTPLKDIEFLWQGKPVTESPTMTEDGQEVPLTLDEWLYTGLSNIDYMYMLLQVVDASFEGNYSFSSETVVLNK
jgi:hypothetical protein